MLVTRDGIRRNIGLQKPNSRVERMPLLHHFLIARLMFCENTVILTLVKDSDAPDLPVSCSAFIFRQVCNDLVAGVDHSGQRWCKTEERKRNGL